MDTSIFIDTVKFVDTVTIIDTVTIVKTSNSISFLELAKIFLPAITVFIGAYYASKLALDKDRKLDKVRETERISKLKTLLISAIELLLKGMDKQLHRIQEFINTLENKPNNLPSITGISGFSTNTINIISRTDLFNIFLSIEKKNKLAVKAFQILIDTIEAFEPNKKQFHKDYHKMFDDNVKNINEHNKYYTEIMSIMNRDIFDSTPELSSRKQLLEKYKDNKVRLHLEELLSKYYKDGVVFDMSLFDLFRDVINPIQATSMKYNDEELFFLIQNNYLILFNMVHGRQKYLEGVIKRQDQFKILRRKFKVVLKFLNEQI